MNIRRLGDRADALNSLISEFTGIRAGPSRRLRRLQLGAAGADRETRRPPAPAAAQDRPEPVRAEPPDPDARGGGTRHRGHAPRRLEARGPAPRSDRASRGRGGGAARVRLRRGGAPHRVRSGRRGVQDRYPVVPARRADGEGAPRPLRPRDPAFVGLRRGDGPHPGDGAPPRSLAGLEKGVRGTNRQRAHVASAKDAIDTALAGMDDVWNRMSIEQQAWVHEQLTGGAIFVGNDDGSFARVQANSDVPLVARQIVKRVARARERLAARYNK